MMHRTTTFTVLLMSMAALLKCQYTGTCIEDYFERHAMRNWQFG
jgi:hypothetical protein